MSIDEQTAAKIDDYLNGRLSTEAKRQFENELISNNELADELEIQKSLLQIIGANNITLSETSAFSRSAVKEVADFLQTDEMMNVRANIREVNSAYFQRDRQPKSIVYAMLGIAASVLIILSIGFLLQPDVDRGSLYTTYKDTFQPLSLVERSASTNITSEIEKQFDLRNYEEVLRLITNDPGLIEQYPSLYLYKGIAYRELGKYDNALSSFDNYAIYSDLDLELVYWHKGLVFLSKGEYDEALSNFEKIDTEGNFKGASEVAKIIDSLK